MKKLFETLDGKMFEDETEAQKYEDNFIKKYVEPRLKKLAEDKVFENFKDGDVLNVGCNFDEEGNSRGTDKIQGSKANVMRYIASRHKYWNIGNRTEIFMYNNNIIKV